MDDGKANQLVKDTYSKFGTITSMVTKGSLPHNGHFGFVCFDNHDSAQAAIDALHD